MRTIVFFLLSFLVCSPLSAKHAALPTEPVSCTSSNIQATFPVTITTEEEGHEETPFVPNIRCKLLAQAYESLADAIEADNVATARSLFVTFPGLTLFSCQPIGTPLHFVKSKKMAQFLIKEIGISPNICDQWGELPSSALQQSNSDRFPSKKEQRALVLYLKLKESAFPKVWNQLMLNKNLQMKISIGVMSTVLLTQLAALVKFLVTK